MLPKALFQLVFTGSQIVGKAFIEAYKQTAKNGAGAAAAAASQSKDFLTRKTGLSLEEATRILNVDSKTEMKELQSKYDNMFKQNDPKNGGSFYLQSKIYRAKERIDLELDQAKQNTK